MRVSVKLSVHRKALFYQGCFVVASLLLGCLLFVGCNTSPSSSSSPSQDAQTRSETAIMDTPLTPEQQEQLQQKVTEAAEKEQARQAAENAQEGAKAALAESKAVEDRIAAGDETAKICYLTFDDGPSENTPFILETLSHYGVYATWFIQGNSANINYLENINAAGHGIGLHTYSHDYAQLYANDDAYFADLAAVQDVVSRTTGQTSNIVRFPGGTSNTVSANYSNGIMTRLASSVPAHGFQYFDWNLSGGDSSSPPPPAENITNNVLSNVGSQQRLCVLMHDTTVKKTTADALPSIIEGLRDRGYTFGIITHDTPPFHHDPGN